MLLGLALAQPVAAQVTAADSAAVLLGVANRLRAEGRTTLSTSILNLIIERYASTPSAVDARRTLAEMTSAVEEASGKTELLVFSTTYGLALGALIPAALGSESPEVYGVGLIVGGPSGFLLGRRMNRNPISEGQASAISFGAIWGAWQAVGWTNVLFDETNCSFDVCYDDDPSGEALARAAVLGSAAGLGLGLGLAQKPISAGTAATVSFGAFWGTWYAAGFAVLAELDDGNDDRLLTTILLGGDAGLVATALLAPKWKLSRNRARLISISGVAGLLAGAGLLLIVQPDGEGSIIVPMVTSAVGLGLGVGWTRDYDDRHRAGSQNPGEALLDRSDGSWRVNLPAPGMRFVDGVAGTRKPALYVPLLKARF
jgi:hypothetical protein